MKKRFFKRAMLPLVALCLVFLITLSSVLARYFIQLRSEQKLVTPEDFYFECNFEDGGLYLFPVGRDFSFDLKNHDAFYRYSTSDVTFSVTFDGEEIAVDQKLTGDQKSTQTITLTADKLTKDVRHEVVITSSAPFAKTIAFEIFVVEDSVENFYTVQDKGNWVQLDLYIGTTEPTELTIQYGSLAPDNTHPLMQAWTTAAGQVTLTGADLHPYTHYTLIFFGTAEVTQVESKTALPAIIPLEPITP